MLLRAKNPQQIQNPEQSATSSLKRLHKVIDMEYCLYATRQSICVLKLDILCLFIKYNLHIFVISSRKISSQWKKYKIFFFTGLDEISSCFSAVQIVYL